MKHQQKDFAKGFTDVLAVATAVGVFLMIALLMGWSASWLITNWPGV